MVNGITALFRSIILQLQIFPGSRALDTLSTKVMIAMVSTMRFLETKLIAIQYITIL